MLRMLGFVAEVRSDECSAAAITIIFCRETSSDDDFIYYVVLEGFVGILKRPRNSQKVFL